MDLRQLAVLCAVAEHGSFSSAARALFTVQSNVSAHVARLEQDLGVALVDRSAGRLTLEGELVVSRARRVQAELDALAADVASVGDEVRGEARLGAIGTTARWLAPLVLAGLRARHPGVRVILVEGPTTSLVPRLLDGQLDAAVVHLPAEDPELSVELLFSEDLVLVAPVGHPLAETDETSLASLAEHPLILPAPGTTLRDDLDEVTGYAGIRLEPLAEIDGVRLTASLAFAQFGPAIVPATAIPRWSEGADEELGWRRVRVPGLPRRQVGLARRRRGLPSAPAKALAGLLVEIVADHAGDHAGMHPLLRPA